MSAPAQSTKILTIGPPAGRIQELLSKVSAIESKHGPFDSLFILGDLFKPTSPTEDGQEDGAAQLSQEEVDLIEGKTTLPIPTYFYHGTGILPSSVQARIGSTDSQAGSSSSSSNPSDAGKPKQVATNLFYLGKCGVAETAQGLRVAFCGGRWDADRWAQSVGQYGDQEALHDEGDLLQAEADRLDAGSPYITTLTVRRLLSNPSFALPKTDTAKGPTDAARAAHAKRGAAGREPQTLAAAKAQAKAQAASAAIESERASLLESRPPLDLLLTNHWPAGVTLFSNAALPDQTARMWGCSPIATLARAGAPRYHFALAPDHRDSTSIAGLDDQVRDIGVFWEREPYLNDVAAMFGSASAPLPHLDGGWTGGRRRTAKTDVITRFISLARFANTKKARWFMALNLVPVSHNTSSPPSKPANVTACPYFAGTSAAAPGDGRKRNPDPASDEPLEAGPNFRFSEDARKRRKTGERDDGPPPPGYACRICGSTEHYIRLCPQKGQQGRHGQNGADGGGGGEEGAAAPSKTDTGAAAGDGPAARHLAPVDGIAGLPSKPAAPPAREKLLPVGPDHCWFCLSNPQCAKHLIVSIGDETYLALPRGALPGDSSALPGGGHVLIVPLSHYSSILELDPDLAVSTISELALTRTRLKTCYRKHGALAVSWEIGKGSAASTRVGHTMVQCVPVPASLESRLLEAFRNAAAEHGYEFETRREEVERFFRPSSPSDGGGGAGEKKKDGGDYFWLELGDEQWLMKGKSGSRWNMQFARQTLAHLLDTPERTNWKACVKSEEDERADTLAFRAALQGSDD